jgi:flagellar basal body-associated protein FliL
MLIILYAVVFAVIAIFFYFLWQAEKAYRASKSAQKKVTKYRNQTPESHE